MRDPDHCESISYLHGEMSLLLTYPRSKCLNILSLHNLITLNVVDFRHFTNPLEDLVRELSCITLDMAVEYETDAAVIIEMRILCMCSVDEIVMVV